MFEFIVDIVSRGGYGGVFLLMLAENLFPPIPSELIMPFAGFVAARGDLNIVLVVLVGTAGSVVGAIPWYYAGRLLGLERCKQLADRFGRLFTMSSRDVGEASGWFLRHGPAVVFFGRLIPAIRTLISIPAGITRMRLLPFFAFSAVGSLLWTSLLACAGYVLQGQYAEVAEYLEPGSKIVVGVVLAVYVYRLVTYRPAR